MKLIKKLIIMNIIIRASKITQHKAASAPYVPPCSRLSNPNGISANKYYKTLPQLFGKFCLDIRLL